MRAVAEKWSKKAGRSLVGRLQEACQRTPDQVPASIPVVVAVAADIQGAQGILSGAQTTIRHTRVGGVLCNFGA